MASLSESQKAIVARAIELMRGVPGVVAIVLGGSHARGRARPDSDIDIGLYYRVDVPFAVDAIRKIAAQLNDAPDPVVSEFGAWGPWVDGGAWLTIDGQRLDLLYRSIDKVEHTLAEAQAGRYEVHAAQQPPFGFFGPTVLGEAAIARPLHDPTGAFATLQAGVSSMPPELVAAVVQNTLWSVEFGLAAFAPKFAVAGDSYGVAGCLSRFAHALVLALFALNRTYLLNDKTALAEVAAFAVAPADFSPRVRATLAHLGADSAALERSVAAFADLFAETRALAGDLYRPTWRL